MGDQYLVVTLPMMDGEIREDIFYFDQEWHLKFLTSQVKAMTDQVNREGEPRGPKQANTMASHWRDFTRMNPSMFFSSKSNEDPQDFLD